MPQGPQLGWQAPGGFQPFDGPVIPGIPMSHHQTPHPPFAPVIPGMPPQSTMMQSGGAPFIPITEGYGRTPGPLPPPPQMRAEEPQEIFIPPIGYTRSRASMGSPRTSRRTSHPTMIPPRHAGDFGPDVHHVSPSSSSSSTYSTERSRTPSRRTPHSRTPSRPSSRTASRRRPESYGPSRSPSRRTDRSGRRPRYDSRSSSGERRPPIHHPGYVPHLAVTNPSEGGKPIVMADNHDLHSPRPGSAYGHPSRPGSAYSRPGSAYG